MCLWEGGRLTNRDDGQSAFLLSHDDSSMGNPCVKGIWAPGHNVEVVPLFGRWILFRMRFKECLWGNISFKKLLRCERLRNYYSSTFNFIIEYVMRVFFVSNAKKMNQHLNTYLLSENVALSALADPMGHIHGGVAFGVRVQPRTSTKSHGVWANGKVATVSQ